MARERSRPAGNDQLSTLFREIRDRAGLSGTEAARRAGTTQPTISRWESGAVVPTPEQATTYTEALGTDPNLTRSLIDLINDLRTNHEAGKPGPRSGGVAFQNRVYRLESAAAVVDVFHPLLIPGPLQTAAYVRAVFSSADLPPEEIDGRTAERLRRGTLLNDPKRSYTFITTAGALGWRSSSPETMARQIDHLADVSQRPNVRLGVITWGTEATTYPSSGFEIYDRRTVMIGSPSGARLLNDADDVTRYTAMLAELENMAVFDNEARDVLSQVAAKYRAMTP